MTDADRASSGPSSRPLRDRVQATSERRESPVQRSWVWADGRWVFTRRVTIAPGGDSGSGRVPVIVLVHGLGMSALTYVPLMKVLAPHAQVWAPDLPGFGRSDKPDHALSLAELAEALQHWVTAAGIQPDCYLGHSLGAQVVNQLALSRPGAVPAAISVGPTRDPAARTLAHQAWRMVRDLPGEPFGLVPLAVRDYLSATPARMVQTMRDAMTLPVHERMRRLTHPILVVRGTRDPVVPHDWVRELVDLLPRGELAEIEGAPHGATFSHPGEMARLILDFLWRTRPS